LAAKSILAEKSKITRNMSLGFTIKMDIFIKNTDTSSMMGKLCREIYTSQRPLA
jgi:hypothetical protein